jgi:hypothetical protein
VVFGELKARFFEALAREDGRFSAAVRAVGANRNTAYVGARKAGVRGRGKSGTSGHPRRAEHDRVRVDGIASRIAAAQVGINVRPARDWDEVIRKSSNSRLHPDGRRIDSKTGVITQVDVSKLPTARSPEAHLTWVEREQIADLRRQGVSSRAIGRELGRPASTIKREIDDRFVDGVYRPYRAQRARAKARIRPQESKLAKHGPLRAYATAKLAIYWSPEQICHPLVIEFPRRREYAGGHRDDLRGVVRPGSRRAKT